MIDIKRKEECCGCNACGDACARQAITFKTDIEGFWYPEVDKEKCVDCGLCEKVCPFLHPQYKTDPITVVAAKNPNWQERMDSSSGGVFLPLAREVIRKGGVVFGAVYDEVWEVHHVYTENMEGVYPMMGSKYVQSRTENTFFEAAQFLKQGREVMFVGSPCQIAGLKGYLRHVDYPNLLAVDFVCHGVPGPGVWRRYLAETFCGNESKDKMPPLAADGENTVLFSSLNAKSPIGDIKFRDKAESGWGKYRFVVRKKSASKADKNSVLLSDIHYQNPYMQGFLTNIYLRPSCYACRVKGGTSRSDLTIGDFWGIHALPPDFNDDKGISLVMVNTQKGNDYFSRLNLNTQPSTMQVVNRCNGSFAHSMAINPKRAKFYSLITQGKTVAQAVSICLRVSLYQRVVTKAKRGVKKVVRRMLGETVRHI